MRAQAEIAMPVILKSQEKMSNPVVMQIDELDQSKNTAKCIGFTSDNQPFKIEVNLDNLEKANLNRIRSMSDEK